MKKLSIEQKARRYDEALKVIKGNLDALNEITETGAETVNIQSIKNCFYRAFPELKESEDEKTMKDLLNFLKSPFIKDNICDWKVDPWIVWLEKQYQIKESDISQQENDYSLTCEDNRIMKDIINTIERYIEHIVNDENYAPDAKHFLVKELEGQIAWLENQRQKPVIEMKTPEESLGIDSETYNKIVDECIYGVQKHDDKIELAFHEGDWIVQENIGTYKVIEICESWYEVIDNQNNHYSIGFDKEYMCHLWSIKDVKDGDVLAIDPWSDYPSSFVAIYKKQNKEYFDSYCFVGFDGKFYKGENGHSTENIHPATKEQCDLLFQKMKETEYEWNAEKKELKKFDFSKPIKYNSNPPSIDKKSDWSEDDEEKFRDVIRLIEQGAPVQSMRDHYANWFKSLKDRYAYTPSEDQMNALDNALSLVKNCGEDYSFDLRTLYEQLKKLKGE